MGMFTKLSTVIKSNINDLISFHLCHNFLHILFNILRWNTTNINIENSPLWGTNNSIRHYGILQ